MASIWSTPAVLAALRSIESGNYGAKPKSPGGASGAYQFIQPTWLSSGGGQYAPEAYLATPAQQDAVATAKVNSILGAPATKDNLDAVADTWYLGHVATAAERDRVPQPSAGNTLTVRQYEQKFLNAYKTAPGAQSGGGLYGAVNDGIKAATGAVGDAASAVGDAVTGALGGLVSPFVEGLKRLAIIGLAVTLGLGMVGAGAWRSVKPNV